MRYQEFLLRRLHSLSGMVPMGAFLFFHLFVNSFSHSGEGKFNANVALLRGMPYLRLIEFSLLFAPFLFHMLYGLKIIYSGQPNVLGQQYGRNWMYFLQRLSAFPAFFFIIFHVYTIWFLHRAHDANLYAVMTDAFANPLVFAFYVIGVVSAAFHFANGIATFCMTWGLTITPLSQRIVGYACAGVGFVLAAMGIWAILGFNEEGLGKGAGHAAEAAPAAAAAAIEILSRAASMIG